MEKIKQSKWERKQRQLKHLDLVGGTETTEQDAAGAKEPSIFTLLSDDLFKIHVFGVS